MTRLLSALLVICLLAPASAFAQLNLARFTPESGWWWNPEEPGTGYSIEIQDDFIFLAAYTYQSGDTPRLATWYTAEGRMENGWTFQTNEVATFRNGTCPDCPQFFPPELVNPPAAFSPLRIDFHTETVATLEWAGVALDIERFDFFLSIDPDIAPKTEMWLGEWQITMDWGGLAGSGNDYGAYPFVGEVWVFDMIERGNLTDFFVGCRPDNSLDGVCSDYAWNNHQAWGQYHDDFGTHIIFVEENPTTLLVFEVEAGTYQFDGYAKRCPDMDNFVTGCLDNDADYPYLPVRGWRSASRTFVTENENAPSSVPEPGAAKTRTAPTGFRSQPAMPMATPSGAKSAPVRSRADSPRSVQMLNEMRAKMRESSGSR